VYPPADNPANRPGLGEVVAVWAMFGVVALAILVTYSWLPQVDSYNFDTTGIAGGLGRAFVFLAFPTSLVAVPIAVLAAAELAARRARIAAAVSIALSATVVLPGNLDQNDLDPKPLNAVTVAGVVLAVALTFAAWRSGAALRWGRLAGDRARAVIAVVLLAGSAPWLLAEVGIYTDDIPLLGLLFTSDEPGPAAGDPVAVHLGHHHGLDGTLLAIAALLLSRPAQRLGDSGLRRFLAAYVSLLFAYGVANAVQDFWLEQFVKRDWVDWEIPTLLRPGLEPAWGVVVLAALATYLAFARLSSRTPASPR
jgi:hypothetical protein